MYIYIYMHMQAKSRQITIDSILHQADQILRQCVSKEIKKHKGNYNACIIKSLYIITIIIIC